MSLGYAGTGKRFSSISVKNQITIQSKHIDGVAATQFQQITVTSSGEETTAILTTTYSTRIDFQGIGEDTATFHALADGAYTGHMKEIVFDGAGTTNSATITPVNLRGGTTVVFTSVATADTARVLFMWVQSEWVVVSLLNAVLS